MSEPRKLCPKCQCSNPLQAGICARCGRQFRTVFNQQGQAQEPPTQMAPPQPQYPAPYREEYPQQVPRWEQPPQQVYQQPQEVWQQSDGEQIQVIPGTHPAWAALLISTACCAFGGQLYNRQYPKAFALAFANIALTMMTRDDWGVAIAVYVTTALFFGFDAYLIAARLNRGERVGRWQFF